MIRRIISLFIVFSLLFQQAGFAQIAGQLDISGYLSAFHNSLTTDKFRPLHLRYLQYLPENNSFKLLLDKGDAFRSPSVIASSASPSVIARSAEGATKQSLEETELQSETQTLLSYFYIGLALPNDSFWVNLRPDAEDNIIDDYLAKTDIGKIMLEADLQLKKDTANFTSPQTLEGKEYWNKLYQKAGELFGSDNITIPTLTRPWIVPDEIIIRETTDSAYVYKATLKVMLEQDYLKSSATYNFQDERLKALNEYSSQLIRELIIPKLTKEINSSKRYAPLRQVYYSLILAQWFKARHKQQPSSLRTPEGGEAISSRIDSRDLTNLISKEAWFKTTYFQAYQKSFKDGEYNIHEPVYAPTGQVIRSYFSGGMKFAMEIPPFGSEIATNWAGRVVSSPAVNEPTGNNAHLIAMGVQAENGAFSVIANPAADSPLAQPESASSAIEEGRQSSGPDRISRRKFLFLSAAAGAILVTNPLKPLTIFAQRIDGLDPLNIKLTDKRIDTYLAERAPSLVIDDNLKALMDYLGKLRPSYIFRIYSREEFTTWRKIGEKAGVYGGSGFAADNYAAFYGPKLTSDLLWHELLHAIVSAVTGDGKEKERRLLVFLEGLRRASSNDARALQMIDDFMEWFGVSYCVRVDENKKPLMNQAPKRFRLPRTTAERAYNANELFAWLFQRLFYPLNVQETTNLTKAEQDYFSFVSPEADQRADALLGRIARNPAAKQYLIGLYVKQLGLPVREQEFIKAFEQINSSPDKQSKPSSSSSALASTAGSALAQQPTVSSAVTAVQIVNQSFGRLKEEISDSLEKAEKITESLSPEEQLSEKSRAMVRALRFNSGLISGKLRVIAGDLERQSKELKSANKVFSDFLEILANTFVDYAGNKADGIIGLCDLLEKPDKPLTDEYIEAMQGSLDAINNLLNLSSVNEVRVNNKRKSIGTIYVSGVDRIEDYPDIVDLSFNASGSALAQPKGASSAIGMRVAPQLRLVQKLTQRQGLMLRELESLYLRGHKQPPEPIVGEEGLKSANEILKREGAVGIVVGSTARDLNNRLKKNEDLSKHGDIDVIVFKKDFKISVPFEGGIDWWLPTEVKKNIKNVWGENEEGKTEIYVNGNGVFLRCKEANIYNRELSPGLYLPSRDLLIDFTLQSVLSMVDTAVEIDEAAKERFEDKLEHIIGRSISPVWKSIHENNIVDTSDLNFLEFWDNEDAAEIMQKNPKYLDIGERNDPHVASLNNSPGKTSGKSGSPVVDTNDLPTDKPSSASSVMANILIPEGEFNALKAKGISELIAKEFVPSDDKSLLAKKEKLREIYSRIVDSQKETIQPKLGRAKFAYYPFGGFDPHTLFTMMPQLTDIFAWGEDNFGSLENIKRFIETADPKDKAGGTFNRYDIITGDLGRMKSRYNITGLGALAITRIVSFLNGEIKGLYYFTLNEDGSCRFINEEGLNNPDNQKNAVIEFTIKEKGKEVTKRYWYLQNDVNESNSHFDNFINKLGFQILFLKAPMRDWEHFNKEKIKRNIMLPAARNKAFFVGDLAANNFKEIAPSIKLSSLKLKEGENIGYSFPTEDIYYGQADMLFASLMQQKGSSSAVEGQESFPSATEKQKKAAEAFLETHPDFIASRDKLEQFISLVRVDNFQSAFAADPQAVADVLNRVLNNRDEFKTFITYITADKFGTAFAADPRAVADVLYEILIDWDNFLKTFITYITADKFGTAFAADPRGVADVLYETFNNWNNTKLREFITYITADKFGTAFAADPRAVADVLFKIFSSWDNFKTLITYITADNFGAVFAVDPGGVADALFKIFNNWHNTNTFYNTKLREFITYITADKFSVAFAADPGGVADALFKIFSSWDNFKTLITYITADNFGAVFAVDPGGVPDALSEIFANWDNVKLKELVTRITADKFSAALAAYPRAVAGALQEIFANQNRYSGLHNRFGKEIGCIEEWGRENNLIQEASVFAVAKSFDILQLLEDLSEAGNDEASRKEILKDLLNSKGLKGLYLVLKFFYDPSFSCLFKDSLKPSFIKYFSGKNSMIPANPFSFRFGRNFFTITKDKDSQENIYTITKVFDSSASARKEYEGLLKLAVFRKIEDPHFENGLKNSVTYSTREPGIFIMPTEPLLFASHVERKQILSSLLEESLSQILSLAEKGLVHTSLTALSHRMNDTGEWPLGYIAELGGDIRDVRSGLQHLNFRPGIGLIDSEHIIDLAVFNAQVSDNIAFSIFELTLGMAYAGIVNGLSMKEIISLFTQPRNGIFKGAEPQLRQTILQIIGNNISHQRNDPNSLLLWLKENIQTPLSLTGPIIYQGVHSKGNGGGHILPNGDTLSITAESPVIQQPAASSVVEDEKGGIDFRSLPIVTQAMSNLRAASSLLQRQFPQPELIARSAETVSSLDKELQDIQRMVEAGITPSAERIREYVASSCLKGNSDMQKVVSCIADILRLEEERCCETEPMLKDMLVVLESGQSAQELKAVFAGG